MRQGIGGLRVGGSGERTFGVKAGVGRDVFKLFLVDTDFADDIFFLMVRRRFVFLNFLDGFRFALFHFLLSNELSGCNGLFDHRGFNTGLFAKIRSDAVRSKLRVRITEVRAKETCRRYHHGMVDCAVAVVR